MYSLSWLKLISCWKPMLKKKDRWGNLGFKSNKTGFLTSQKFWKQRSENGENDHRHYSFGAKNIPRFSQPTPKAGPGPSDGEEHSPGHSPEHLQNLSTPTPRPSKSRGISAGSSPPGAEERFAMGGKNNSWKSLKNIALLLMQQFYEMGNWWMLFHHAKNPPINGDVIKKHVGFERSEFHQQISKRQVW